MKSHRALFVTLAVLSGTSWLARGEQPEGPVKFSEQRLADNKFDYVFGLAAADLDGDGDLDLTHPAIQDPSTLNKSYSTLYWYRNDGNGKFDQQIIFQGELGWFERHAIGDIDGNGTLDIAIVNNEKGTLIWFENSGKPAAGPWRRRVISTNCPKAYNVALADFDGDGDLDAGAVGYTSNQVSWYENPGKDQLGRQWTRRLIDGALQEARTIATGDFNRDGKVDLLVACVGAPNVPNYESQVVWYENPGQPAKQDWTKRIISKEFPAAIHGHPVDLDGDGDLDVVMAHGMRVEAAPRVEHHQVVWYENVGKPRTTPTWKRHTVGLLPMAFEATAGDIDGDGDLDIAATAWSKGDRVVWFENRGDAGWSQHLVRTDFRAANQLILSDLNGDGRLDIIAGADDGSRRVDGSREVRWWRNDGRAADFVPSKPVKTATPADFSKFRKILVSPTVNTPKPFQGFGGWCGWPDVCRLKNGDLFVTFSAGYYHASWPTPLDMPSELKELYSKHVGEWLFEWDCPTGGQTMWIRSRDNGRTWTRPKAFPETRGGYYASDVIQLRDGTMLASVRVSPSYGHWPRMPATPLEFARTAADRLDQHNRVFRSDDNGETWRAVGRIASFGWNDGVYSFCQRPDDSVLAIYNFSPIPDGPGWEGKNSRWLTGVAHSSDKGTTWKTLSITGSNEFNSFESTGGYLPDGRIGFITRPGSHWFESSDHGRTWSQPTQMFPSVNGKPVGFARGELQVLPNGVVAVVFCDISGNHGQLIYSRDNGKRWIKPAEVRGFQFDPISYYPDACVLEDGSLFVVGCHEGLGKNKYGPAGAEVTAMRFRIKDANEGEGLELLPIGDR